MVLSWTRISPSKPGQSLIWLEQDKRWAVCGYHRSDGLELSGRKDRVDFARDKPGDMSGVSPLPDDYRIENEPEFLRDGDRFYRWAGCDDVDTYPGIACS